MVLGREGQSCVWCESALEWKDHLFTWCAFASDIWYEVFI